MEEVIAEIASEISRRSGETLDLLQLSLQARSVSGEEKYFTTLLADWARERGFNVDLWDGDEKEIERHFGAVARHIPLAGRPTLHVGWVGNPERKSVLFNGHSDVVAAPEPERWRYDPWGGQLDGKMVYGRGACDVKGAIVAALWAMAAINKVVPAAERGAIGMEVVPGEEDCVGLGTLTSIARGYKSDGVVVLEPTEGMPRCASRGGCRFEIIATGRSVHGTVKWLGVDAIAEMHHVITALNNIERRWNDPAADPLFAGYPIMRPITVDKIEGGVWQGMICDRCRCGGYLELLPGDALEESKARLRAALTKELQHMGQDEKNVQIEFGEEYHGHRTESDHPICLAAKQSVIEQDAWSGWRGFNSGCEAGVRAELLGTPTLVWGPGSLEFAHAVDERIDFRDIELAARRFARFILAWGQLREPG